MKVIMYTIIFVLISSTEIAEQKGLKQVDEIFIDKSEDDLLQMIEITQRRTVPQIFINDQHVGGFDDLREFDRSVNWIK